jgi:hypothetical protein
MMKNVLVRLDKLDKAHNPASQVNKVWVKKDETVHPLKGSRLTYLVRSHHALDFGSKT